MCWVQFIIAIVIAIVGEAIRPKAKSNTGRPAGLGDFQFPTAEAGRVIPWLAGTVKILGPNTTASGLLRSEESYKRVRTGWWSTAKQSYGFRYYITIQQVYCGGPIDDVVGFQVNEKMLKTSSITRTTHYIDVQVDDAAFYGDRKKDGGFSGLIRVWRGTPTQGTDEWLKAVLDQDEISAYRYVCHAIFRDFYISMSNNPPPILPIIARWPNTLGVTTGHHIIRGRSSNVICAVYDLMTDAIRGMSVPAAKIDRAAFLSAAETCYADQIGWSGIIDGTTSGKDAVDEMMAYADGQVFEDPFTGLWTVKLVRPDYVVANLPVLNEDNSRCVSKTKTDWPDTKNVVSVAYVDADKNWTNQSVQSFDSGNLAVLGQTSNQITRDFSGIDHVAQANFTAERIRASVSVPFTQMEIEASGIGATLKLNDPFVASYPKTKRIELMVMRVSDITYPNNNETTTNIKAVEDKFGVQFVVFNETSTEDWTPPDLTPHPPAAQRLDEVPWAMTPSLDGQRYAMTMAARADGVTTGYEVWQSAPSTSTLTKSSDDGDLTAVGQLAVALGTNGGYSSGSIVLDQVIDGQDITSAFAADFAAGKSLLWIGNELIAFQTVTANGDGTISLTTIRRAVYDTVPEIHPVGQNAFIVNTGATLVQEQPYASDMTIGVRLASSVGDTALAPTTDPLMLLAMSSRAQRPYPPGRVLVNTLWAGSNPAISSGDLTFDWRHRGKVTLGEKVVAYDDNSNYGPDAGTTYELKIYNNATSALLYSQTGITTTNAVVPASTFTGSLQLRVELVAVIGGIKSQFPVVSAIAYGP